MDALTLGTFELASYFTHFHVSFLQAPSGASIFSSFDSYDCHIKLHTYVDLPIGNRDNDTIIRWKESTILLYYLTISLLPYLCCLATRNVFLQVYGGEKIYDEARRCVGQIRASWLVVKRPVAVANALRLLYRFLLLLSARLCCCPLPAK
jgi:hypothetical protein